MKAKHLHGAKTTIQLLFDRMLTSRQSPEVDARCRTVTHQASEGIFLLDGKSGHVLEANAAFQNMFGYDAAEIPELVLGDLIVDRGRNSSAPAVDVAGLIGEKRCRRKDGTQFDAKTSANIFTTHKGRAISVVIRDLTELKALCKKLGGLSIKSSRAGGAGGAVQSLSPACRDRRCRHNAKPGCQPCCQPGRCRLLAHPRLGRQ
jgi:PAS domain S-box-containing protein